MKTMKWNLLLISIILTAAIANAAGLADMLWSAGANRLGQVASQNPDSARMVQAYEIASSNPSGYMQQLAQSTVCNARENQQACTTINAIVGLQGGAGSLVTTFCSLQGNNENEMCTSYQKGMEAFGQFENVRGMFSNPGQAAQTYALGEMTKRIDPRLGQGIQTITSVQGKLNSLSMGSSGNSGQLLQTALNSGISAASGERVNALGLVTGNAITDELATINENTLRQRQCAVSFDSDGTIREIYNCKTTRPSTDISFLINSTRQVLIGADCNLIKIRNELSVIAEEGQSESMCKIVMRDRNRQEPDIIYQNLIPISLDIDGSSARSGYFKFIDGQLDRAIMLSSRNGNELSLGERKIIIGKGVIAIYGKNEVNLNYDYVERYHGESRTNIQARNGNSWQGIGTLTPGRNTRIRQLENGVEISGQNFNVELANRNIAVKRGRTSILNNGEINIGRESEAIIHGRNSRVYIETANDETKVEECPENTLTRGRALVTFCNDGIFTARGNNINAGPLNEFTTLSRQSISSIAAQNGLSIEAVCRFNSIENCNKATEIERGQRINLPTTVYSLRNNGWVTRDAQVQGSRTIIRDHVSNAVRYSNGFGLESLQSEDRIMLRDIRPSGQETSTTTYDNNRQSINTPESVCLTPNNECGTGSVIIHNRIISYPA